MIKVVLGIIIFCIWYLTIGIIMAFYNYLNCRDDWDEAADVMLKMTDLPADKESVDIGLFCVIIIFWGILFIKNVMISIRLKFNKIVRKIKRGF